MEMMQIFTEVFMSVRNSCSKKQLFLHWCKGKNCSLLLGNDFLIHINFISQKNFFHENMPFNTQVLFKDQEL